MKTTALLLEDTSTYDSISFQYQNDKLRVLCVENSPFYEFDKEDVSNLYNWLGLCLSEELK